MGIFAESTEIHYEETGSGKIVEAFFEEDDGRRLETCQMITARSNELRQCLEIFCSTPSEIQGYARALKPQSHEHLQKFFRGQIQALIGHVFGRGVVQPITELVERAQDLHNCIREPLTENTVREQRVRINQELESKCRMMLFTRDAFFTKQKFELLKWFVGIRWHTKIAAFFADDEVINPQYSHLLDKHLASVRSRQTAPLS